MKWLRFASLGWVVCAVGCGGTPETPGETTFPYVGEHGELVCSESTRVDESTGQKHVLREQYHVAAMNEQLTGRGSLDPGALAAMREAGLAHVSTCEDARRYAELERSYVESQPLGTTANTDSLPTPAETDAASEPMDKVADGQNNTLTKVVRVQQFANGAWQPGCSGVIISRRALLTAASCFNQTGQFRKLLRVDHGRGPTGGATASIQCVSSAASCPNAPSSTLTNTSVSVFPGFTGFLDSARDLAVVVSDTNWTPFLAGDPPISMMHITVTTANPGMSYLVNGYGAHADTGSGLGIHRQANRLQGFDDRFAGYFRDTVQSGIGRPCRGDAGSPAINTDRVQLDLALALSNNFDTANGGFCPEPGNFFRYTDIGNKISFIESVIGPCTPFDFGMWNFRQCF